MSSLRENIKRAHRNLAGGELSQRMTERPAQSGSGAGAQTLEAPSYVQIKSLLHQQLLAETDIWRLDLDDTDAFSRAVTSFVERALQETNFPLTREERERLAQDILEESLGLGPLSSLLSDPAVSDILVNGPHQVYVERFGRLEESSIRFSDDLHLMKIIERIATSVGRHIDEKSPMVDARLADGSRVNAVIPPLSLVGPVLSIRRFGVDRLTLDDMLKIKTLSQDMADFLAACVRGRLNIIISGGTGTGKTTMLNILSAFISSQERIITIEDAAELALRQKHVVRMETRPSNIEGEGRVSARDLVINALRMRPDRIVVGEVRAGEALDMLQAMNTGHDGSLTTVHANTPRDALNRLETMVLMAGMDLPSRAIREQIASAIDLIIQIERLLDGSRRITSITELVGMEGDKFTTQELFRFLQQGMEGDRVIGQHQWSGLRPRCTPRLEARGITLPAGMRR